MSAIVAKIQLEQDNIWIQIRDFEQRREQYKALLEYIQQAANSFDDLDQKLPPAIRAAHWANLVNILEAMEKELALKLPQTATRLTAGAPPVLSPKPKLGKMRQQKKDSQKGYGVHLSLIQILNAVAESETPDNLPGILEALHGEKWHEKHLYGSAHKATLGIKIEQGQIRISQDL